MGIEYKAVMCPAVAGKFVERFAETLVSSLATINISVTNGRATVALTATTDLGEAMLVESLNDGELSQWEYGKRFRVPISVGGILIEG